MPEENRMPGKAATTVVTLSLVLSVGFGFLAGFIGSAVAEYDPWRGLGGPFGELFGSKAEAYQPVAEEPPEDFAAAAAAPEALEDMIERVSPAVVSIVVNKEVPKMERVMVDPFGDNSFFQQFFGGGIQVPQYRQNGTEEQRIGAGTGFFVSADGYVVTNKHVVADDEAEYTIIVSDEEKYVAKVLARDPVSDIAILKVDSPEGRPFPAMTLGDSDGLRVGESVVAIGYALGQYDNTVSRGIVSGLRRRITAGGVGIGTESLFDLIQTDTAINPGNSGGPLLNMRGEAVGVNVAVDLGGQNIGFSLPINEVRDVFESVRDTGKISRPWLGVRYVMIDEQMVKENQLGVDHGALVVRGGGPTELAVVPGSPADKAGIEENDIILKIDGEKVTVDRPLSVLLARRKAGDKVTMTVLRKGEEQDIEVTLEERQ